MGEFMIKCDIVVGLSYGDEGKGKITNYLITNKNYDRCIRFNGGCNAGHTIYNAGKKVVTHHIPAGALHGVTSIIGPGCVVDPEKFMQEIDDLENAGFSVYNNIKIANNAHVIQDAHKEFDRKDIKIGTTRSGNGPAYSEKYARTGIRAEEDRRLSDFIIDYSEELQMMHAKDYYILFEGAQGFGLDIDHGNYPYVTSSHCTSSGALLNGASWKSVNRVYGIAKCYDTYVGALKFQDIYDSNLEALQVAGNEYGATTGRKRQCNYLDIELLKRSLIVNGVTDVIFNKLDVLREVDVWRVINHGKTLDCFDEKSYKSFITDTVREVDPDIKVRFSASVEVI